MVLDGFTSVPEGHVAYVIELGNNQWRVSHSNWLDPNNPPEYDWFTWASAGKVKRVNGSNQYPLLGFLKPPSSNVVPGAPNLSPALDTYFPLGGSVVLRATATSGTMPQQTRFWMSNGAVRDWQQNDEWDVSGLASGEYTWWAKKRNAVEGPDSWSRFHMNYPPNVPTPQSPLENVWINSRDVTLLWNDPGDPDNRPNAFRDYKVEIKRESGGWSNSVGWGHLPTSWALGLPSDDRYTWRVAAGDGWNNRGFSAEVSFFVDTTAPTTEVPVPNVASPSGATAVTFALSGWDSYSGVASLALLVDGATVGSVAGASGNVVWNTAGLTEGPHNVQVRATDAAGNTATSGTLVYVLDRTPPVTTATLAGTIVNGWYTSSVVITLTATDAVAGVREIRYRLDGGPETVYTGPITTTEDGYRRINYYARDLTNPVPGNQEAEKTTNYKVDRTAPTAVVARDQGADTDDPTTLLLDVSATEPHTGLVTLRYALTTNPNASDASLTWLERPFGGATSAFHVLPNLNLPAGQTWYVKVQVVNGVNLRSATVRTDGITVSAEGLPYRLRQGNFTGAGFGNLTDGHALAGGVALQGSISEWTAANLSGNANGRAGARSDYANGYLYSGFLETLVPFTYEGHATFQSFLGNKANVPLTLRLLDVAGLTLWEANGATDAAGDFAIRAWQHPDAVRQASLGGWTFLRDRVAVEPSPNPFTDYPFIPVTLLNGDVNGDNRVNIADFIALRAAFGSSPGSGSWNPRADLNGDGTVGIADFLILRANFGRSGDD